MHVRSLSPELVAPRVEELADRRLRESPYYYLRNLHCHFDAGILTVRGRVPYQQLQALAEQIVARVEGVREVVNQVEVYDPVLAPVSSPAVRSAG